MAFRSRRRELLPPELDRMIHGLLCQEDLASLCLTDLTSRAVAEPFLYSHVILHSGSCGLSALFRFSHSILQRPELARHIESLVIVGCDVDCIHYNTTRYSIAESELHWRHSVKTQCIERITDASGLTPNGSIDCCLTFLLSQSHRLRNLFVSPSYAREGQSALDLCRFAVSDPDASNAPKLVGLRRVSYLCSDDNFEQGGETFRQTRSLVLLYLPDLEHLAISLDNTCSPLARFGDPSGDFTTLTSLELTLATEHNLLELLPRMVILKQLSWTIVFHSLGQGERTSEIDLQVLSSALNHVRTTLTRLEIKGTQRQWESAEPHLVCQGSLQTLSKFPRLEKLELPFQLLGSSFVYDTKMYAGSVVPKSVSHLIINHDLSWAGSDEYDIMLSRDLRWSDENLYDFIVRYVGDPSRTRHAQGLLTIMLHESDFHDTSDFWAHKVQEFREICKDHGVCVEFGRRSQVWRLEDFLQQWPLEKSEFGGKYERPPHVHRSQSPLYV